MNIGSGNTPTIPSTDLPARLVVRVTQAHLALGQRDDCKNCPVVLALNDCGLREVEVMPGGKNTISYFDPGTWSRRTVTAPRAVRKFVSEFDFGSGARPFQFEIRLREGSTMKFLKTRAVIAVWSVILFPALILCAPVLSVVIWWRMVRGALEEAAGRQRAREWLDGKCAQEKELRETAGHS
jgi:hypothetical protein